MDPDRLITTAQGEELASKWPGCTYIEASAKKNKNVQQVFIELTKKMVSMGGKKDGGKVSKPKGSTKCALL